MNNSNYVNSEMESKDEMENSKKQLFALNSVEDFNPHPLKKEILNIEGETVYYLPVTIKKAWFRYMYPTGYFKTKVVAKTDNSITIRVRIYGKQKHKHFMAEAQAIEVYNESNYINVPEEAKYNMMYNIARGKAISAALAEAGFGLGYWYTDDIIYESAKTKDEEVTTNSEPTLHIERDTDEVKKLCELIEKRIALLSDNPSSNELDTSNRNIRADIMKCNKLLEKFNDRGFDEIVKIYQKKIQGYQDMMVIIGAEETRVKPGVHGEPLTENTRAKIEVHGEPLTENARAKIEVHGEPLTENTRAKIEVHGEPLTENIITEGFGTQKSDEGIQVERENVRSADENQNEDVILKEAENFLCSHHAKQYQGKSYLELCLSDARILPWIIIKSDIPHFEKKIAETVFLAHATKLDIQKYQKMKMEVGMS